MSDATICKFCKNRRPGYVKTTDNCSVVEIMGKKTDFNYTMTFASIVSDTCKIDNTEISKKRLFDTCDKFDPTEEYSQSQLPT